MADSQPTQPQLTPTTNPATTPAQPVSPASSSSTTTHDHEEPKSPRKHPEFDDKQSDELVELEKEKIHKIKELVVDIKTSTSTLDTMIEEARESHSIQDRNERIGDIKSATVAVHDKVLTAAELGSEVKEINAVLKERKINSDDEGEDDDSTKGNEGTPLKTIASSTQTTTSEPAATSTTNAQ